MKKCSLKNSNCAELNIEPYSLSPGILTIPDEKNRRQCSFQGIPGVEILDSGRLFACFYAGTEPGEGPGNYIVVSMSDDKGLSWREILTVIPPTPQCRAYDPVLWRTPGGLLYLFWSQCQSTSIGDCFDGRAGVWCAYCTAPERMYLEWSSPRRIAEGVMMNKPVVRENGEWVLPVALWSIYPEKLPENLRSYARSNLLLSRDHGRSFEFRQGPDIPERTFDEHVIVELRDGTLWLLARTSYGIGCSYSQDCGQTWSPPMDSRLGGPGSRFAMRRLRSGKLCLVNHQVTIRLPGECRSHQNVREKLTVWLSNDDGQTWYGRLLLDPGSDVSYPDLAEGCDGFIYVIYDQGRTKHGQIMFARFTEQDVKIGTFITPGAYGKVVISAFS